MKRNKIYVIFLITIIFIVLFASFPIYGIQKPDQTAISLEKRGLHPLLITGLISLLPIFELRGAIPVGISLFKQKPLIVYFIAVFYNLIPIFPILYLLLPVRNFLVRRRILSRFFNYLDNKARKNSKIVEKYGEFGLALFVAIPLPITGAWTGSLIAVIMGLSPIKSFLFISLGVIFAGGIVILITLVGMKSLILIVPIFVGLILLMVIKYLKTVAKKRRVGNEQGGGGL